MSRRIVSAGINRTTTGKDRYLATAIEWQERIRQARELTAELHVPVGTRHPLDHGSRFQVLGRFADTPDGVRKLVKLLRSQGML